MGDMPSTPTLADNVTFIQRESWPRWKETVEFLLRRVTWRLPLFVELCLLWKVCGGRPRTNWLFLGDVIITNSSDLLTS